MPISNITETVLIVDDSVSVSGAVEAELRQRGYGTVVTQNGAQALVMAQEYRPDLILLDIMMPDVDGYTICQYLKADSKTKDIPVIFLSALNSTFDKVKAFKCGAVDFVSKPVQSEELVARVKAHLTIGALARELQNSNRSLEQKVLERTEDLRASNRQLAELNKKLEQAIKDMQEAKEQAESSSATKAMFLSKISHEIFNSSNIIEGFAELIKSTPDMAKHAEYAECIKESADSLVAEVSQMEEYDNAMSGTCRVSMAPVSVAAVLESVYSAFIGRASRRGLGIVVSNGNPSGLEIVADEQMLCSILSKLVSNSLKFSQSGSVEIGASTSRDSAVFYVKDTGIGISPDFMDKIYQPFARGGKSFDPSGEGLGLGLPVAQKYVEMLGGEIWIDSTPGAGTICYVSLPALSKDADAAAPAFCNARVLVGEDEDEPFALLANVLEPMGISIIRARTGRELIEMFRQDPEIGLVISRPSLPVMSGSDAMRLIRRLAPGIETVAMSPLESDQDKRGFAESGCRLRIDRPATPAQARDVIGQCLLED